MPWDHEGEKEGKVAKLESLPEELMQQEKQTIKEELKQPYAFHTKRRDHEKYGYSTGCPGCGALLTGTTKQKHTPQCRQRMEKEIGELERVKNAKRRREEFLGKVTVPADGEVADEDTVKKTSKNYDIKINDDEMTLDVRVTSSGINESARMRAWQEIDGQDSASKSKKEKHEIDKEGDV